MTRVMEIKRRHEAADMDELLRAIAPAARRNQAARQRREKAQSAKRRVNARLARVGIPLRVV